MRKVILSSPLLLEEGTFSMREIGIGEAVKFAGQADNFCGHEQVRILGLDPRGARKVCGSYDAALVIKPNNRIEYNREYTISELEEIGYSIYLINKVH